MRLQMTSYRRVAVVLLPSWYSRTGCIYEISSNNHSFIYTRKVFTIDPNLPKPCIRGDIYEVYAMPKFRATVGDSGCTRFVIKA